MDGSALYDPSWHPITKLAWFVAMPPLGFVPGQKLEEALGELAGTAELRPAVLSLVSLAKHFDDVGMPEAAERLLSAARTMIPALELGRDDEAERARDERKKQTAVFQRFQGQAQAPSTAPRFGVPAKAGSIRVADLQSRGRRLA
jgi:hypothetical protein